MYTFKFMTNFKTIELEIDKSNNLASDNLFFNV